MLKSRYRSHVSVGATALVVLTLAVVLYDTSVALQLAAPAEQAVRRARTVAWLVLAGLAIFAPIFLIWVRRDGSMRAQDARARVRSEARFRAALDGSFDAFYILRAVRDSSGDIVDFVFEELNAKAEALLGVSREEVVGQGLCELIPANRTNGFFQRYCHVLATGTRVDEEVEITTPDVRAAWIHHQIVPLEDGIAITSRDVTERKQREEALRSLSLGDDLTGLYNRRGFLTLAQQQLKLAKRGNRELLLLFVDMDDFKDINDRFGHAEGDRALQRAAGILRRTFRDSDVIARLGGDEFVVLATDVGHASREVVVTRLRDALVDSNARDGAPYRLSFSVGVASFDPERPPEIDDLLSTADQMLYQQKAERRQRLSA